MSLTIYLNSANVINNGYNSTYNFKFLNGCLNIPENSEMCISNITIPYSWFNIQQQQYNNFVFQYTMPTSAGVQTFTVTLPNGFYAVTDINNYLQTIFIQNGHYIVNTTGQNIYYLSLQYNVTYYAIQVICYTLPTSLPTGYTNPGNMTFPATTLTPQLIISGNNFGAIIGFLQGSYPTTPQLSNQSILSNTLPNGSPINALILRCNLIENNVCMPLDSIPINALFGNNITYLPPYAKSMKVKPGRYANTTFTIIDQNLNSRYKYTNNLKWEIQTKQHN